VFGKLTAGLQKERRGGKKGDCVSLAGKETAARTTATPEENQSTKRDSATNKRRGEGKRLQLTQMALGGKEVDLTVLVNGRMLKEERGNSWGERKKKKRSFPPG